MRLLTPCGKDVNIMYHYMVQRTLNKLSLIILLCVSSLAAGCGVSVGISAGSDAPYVTPINQNDPKTLQGTYSIDSAYVSCTDGSSYSSASPSTTAFYGYYAYDGVYDYWDYYYANTGGVLLDDSYRELVSFSTTSYSSLVTILSPYTFKIQYFGVPATGGVLCDETYYYKKMSDSLLIIYFRFMRMAEKQAAISAQAAATDTTAADTKMSDQQTQQMPSAQPQAQVPNIAPDSSLPGGITPTGHDGASPNIGDKGNMTPDDQSHDADDIYKSADDNSIRNRTVFKIPNFRGAIKNGSFSAN